MWWHFSSLTQTMPNNLLVTLILLLQCIFNGAALKCFVCDSKQNPDCTDVKLHSNKIAPEECSLEKMKSINTWLFELNKFSYFSAGSGRSPLMNCQKVVTRDLNTTNMVTARFCQLDLGQSDACTILKTRLKKKREDFKEQVQYNGGFGGASGGVGLGGGDADENMECSICNTDCCNGSKRLRSSVNMILTGSVAAAIVLIMQKCSGEW